MRNQRFQLLARPFSGFLSALALCLCITNAAAQEPAAPAEPKKAPARTLKILPLGDAPPFRQEIRDGVRYELEPPAGSIPPREIAFGTPEAETAVRLNLGRVSEPVPIPAGALPFTLRLPSAAEDEVEKPWIKVSLPEFGDVLALVWRNPGGLWTEPRVLLLPEDPAAFPIGNLRIVNLTAAPIAVILGADRLSLTPGQKVVKPMKIGIDTPIQLAYSDAAGRAKRFHSAAVLLNEGERAQLIIHRADGEKPRTPLKVITLNERLP